MKKLLAASLLALAGWLTAPSAQAQNAPNFPTTPGATEAGARSGQLSARDQRRARMTPEEARRDQQLEILEARTGTSATSFSRGSGPARQYESSNGSFKLKKFQSRISDKQQKRGMAHAAPGIDPRGERLIDRKHKRHFLFF